MEELFNLTYEAFNRYFTVLEKTGYIKEGDVNKLLLLSFLLEFLEEFNGYITEEDYTLIDKIIQCLSGTSCLIPYMKYTELSVPIKELNNTIFIRISEEEDIRHLEEESGLRLVNL